jgi:hypothetical protein
VFLLNQPTLNFSSNLKHFLDPPPNISNVFQQYWTHICICNQYKDMRQFCIMQRLYMLKKKTLFNSKKNLMFCLNLQCICLLGKPYLPSVFLLTMLAETQQFFLGLIVDFNKASTWSTDISCSCKNEKDSLHFFWLVNFRSGRWSL